MAIEKCFLDTNILIDHILVRRPFEKEANEILDLSEQNVIMSSLSMLTLATASFYAEKMYEPLLVKELFIQLSSFCEILPATKKNLDWAVHSKFTDLEDGIQNHIAESNGCTTIITRNKKDFKKSKLAVLTPEEFLATL